MASIKDSQGIQPLQSPLIVQEKGNSLTMSKRINFTPVDGLMEIIEEFQKTEFCRDRAEAINRMIANTAKRWKAQQKQGDSSHA